MEEKRLVYLCGAVTGLDREVRRRAFSDAERYFRGEGYDVFNPLNNGLEEGAGYETHMKRDLSVLVTRADYICHIDAGQAGIPFSRGAYIEKRVAEVCGIPFINLKNTDDDDY